MSVTSASRDAPRMPLPTLSTRRAAIRHSIEDASGKIGDEFDALARKRVFQAAATATESAAARPDVPGFALAVSRRSDRKTPTQKTLQQRPHSPLSSRSHHSHADPSRAKASSTCGVGCGKSRRDRNRHMAPTSHRSIAIRRRDRSSP